MPKIFPRKFIFSSRDLQRIEMERKHLTFRIYRWFIRNLKYLVPVLLMYLMISNLWYKALPSDVPSVICSFGTGRLGNQMSSFATLHSFSRLKGYNHFVTKDQKEMLEYYFQPNINRELHTVKDDLKSYFVDFFGLISISRIRWEKPWVRIDNVDNNFNYSSFGDDAMIKGRFLNGGDYPNEVQYFKEFLPEIRRMFTLKEKFRKSAAEKLEQAQKTVQYTGEPIFVGVHVRRGDYGEHLTQLYNLSILDESYFKQAMEFYRERYKSVIFVVVSDDLSWAQESLVGQDVVFLGNLEVLGKDLSKPLKAGDDIGEDLALLAACNHTIMSFGTFGMWGSLLAGGRVVVPSTFLLTKEGKEVVTGGLIQGQSWHVIPVLNNQTSID